MEVDDATETLFSPFGGKIPQVTYGLPFPEACRKHVDTLFKASRVYIICSASLAKSTEALVSLQSALGSKVVGTRIGMKPHTLWSEILEIVKEARDVKADLLITLGAGSLTDGAKIVALVGIIPQAQNGFHSHLTTSRLLPTTPQPSTIYPAFTLTPQPNGPTSPLLMCPSSASRPPSLLANILTWPAQATTTHIENIPSNPQPEALLWSSSTPPFPAPRLRVSG